MMRTRATMRSRMKNKDAATIRMRMRRVMRRGRNMKQFV